MQLQESIVFNLSYHNRELSAILYGTKIPRKEVDWVLRKPESFLIDLKDALSKVSRILVDITSYAKRCGISLNNLNLDISDTESYVFSNFTQEDIFFIKNFHCIKENTNCEAFRINLQNYFEVLQRMQNDVIVSIIRFEDYLAKYPDCNSRNRLVEQNLPLDSY